MLFKHKHLLEELRKSGCGATAEILSMKTMGESSSIRSVWAPDEDLTTGWFDCRMKLRVIPHDRRESPFEATVLTRIHTLKFQGSHVPVWYDANDRSRVVVDYEADVQEHMHFQPASEDSLAHRYDQRVGLAWTPVGGELLPVEVTVKRGKGHLNATGRLGELVKEPAQIAVSYVRGNAAGLLPTLDHEWFASHDIQIDQAYGALPAGATAEDGASAGAAIAAALVSLLSGRLVRTDVAVTGKVTLTGELLPVSGLKEKVIAAKRNYAQRFVAPAGNEQDVHKIPERQRQNLEFVFASTLDEALRAALAKHHLKGYSPPV
jgi:ATP-dependent Lon protease